MSLEVFIEGKRYVEAETPERPPDVPDGYLSPHFRISEFDCNHCGKYGEDVAKELLVVLEDVRAYFGGKPVTVTSGVRCPFHNNNVGGAAHSTHLSEGSLTYYPCAADITIAHVNAHDVYDYLNRTYPDKYGIGRYSSFTHIDTRPDKARW